MGYLPAKAVQAVFLLAPCDRQGKGIGRALSADLVLGQVHRDASQPRPQPHRSDPLAVVLAEGAVRPYERLLGHVFGVAPVRRYLPGLIDDVLADRINPGRVFDLETDLAHVADAYAAMDERRAIKAAIEMAAA